MPQGVEVQVLSSAPSLPCRLMVGQQPLELFIVVRIHAGQQKLFKSKFKHYFGIVFKLTVFLQVIYFIASFN